MLKKATLLFQKIFVLAPLVRKQTASLKITQWIAETSATTLCMSNVHSLYSDIEKPNIDGQTNGGAGKWYLCMQKAWMKAYFWEWYLPFTGNQHTNLIGANAYQNTITVKVRSLLQHSCAILISFKIVVNFISTSAEIITKSAAQYKAKTLKLELLKNP